MTTTMHNVMYTEQKTAFRKKALPESALPFLFALADCTARGGQVFLKTDEAKAMLFVLLQMAYGKAFRLEAATEHKRLDKAIEKEL